MRINAVEAVLTGTVGVPDDDNPEVRNSAFWTLSPGGYVVAANHTAADAISDLVDRTRRRRSPRAANLVL